MNFDCEIMGGTFVTPEGRQTGTIAIRDGRIAALLEELSHSAARTMDVAGLLVLPGMVDQHVHFMDPSATEREDFIRGSSAAAVGGVTTVTTCHAREDARSTGRFISSSAVAEFGNRSCLS